MADDINNSGNRRGMNTSRASEELRDIGAREGVESGRYRNVVNQYQSTRAELNGVRAEIKANPALADTPLAQMVPGLFTQMRQNRTRMNSMDEDVNRRSELAASKYINQQFASSTINGQVSGMQRDTNIQLGGMSMSRVPYDELTRQKEDIYAQIAQQQKTAQNAIRGAYTGRGQFNPSAGSQVDASLATRTEGMRQIAQINAAQRLHTIAGTDPSSKSRFLMEMGGEASALTNKDTFAKEFAQNGQRGSMSIESAAGPKKVSFHDVDKELITQAKALSEALEKLSSGTLKAAEQMTTLEKAEEAANNMKKLKEAQAAGAGGGSTFSGVGALNGISGAFGAFSNAGQQIMLNQRMQEINNAAGGAGIANQQYDEYKRARGGNVAAQLALGNWNTANDFGVEMKNASTIVTGMDMVANGASAGAGAAQAINGAKNTVGTLGFTGSQETMAGIQGAVTGGSNLAVSAFDLKRGASRRSAQLAGLNASHNAAMAINAIPAEQMQGMRDFYTDMDVATQGAGSRASDLISGATSSENMSKMIGARMSPEQFAKLSGQGIEQMGSTFDSESIYKARAMERNGFGSAQANMQRMATLSTAGGNNPMASMQGVLEAAFTKSLDSSKSLNLMVEHTAQMAAGTSAATLGIDTTGAGATMLAAQTNPNMANKEAALQQAMTASQITKQQTTDRSGTWTGIMNTASIRKATGMSQLEAIAAQSLTGEELNAVAGDTNATVKLMRNKGINATAKNAEFYRKTLINEKQTQTLNPLIGMGLDRNAMAQKLRDGTASEEDRRLIALSTTLGTDRQGGGAETERAFASFTAGNSAAGINKAKAATTNGAANNIKTQTDDLRTSGFQQMSQAANQAAMDLKAFGGALQVLTTLTQKYEKDGQGNEKGFGGAAKEYAGFGPGMEKSITKFSSASGKLEEASKAIINHLLKSDRNPIRPTELDGAGKWLDKVTGKKK